MLEAIRELHRAYGKQAFGAVVVLLLWFTCVQPNLSAAMQAHKEAVELSAHLAEAARATQGAGASLQAAAEALERIAPWLGGTKEARSEKQ